MNNQASIAQELERLASIRVGAESAVARAAASASGQSISQALTLKDILRKPHVAYNLLEVNGYGGPDTLGSIEQHSVAVEIKYEGFIRRQAKQLEKVGIVLVLGDLFLHLHRNHLRQEVMSSPLVICRWRQRLLKRFHRTLTLWQSLHFQWSHGRSYRVYAQWTLRKRHVLGV